MNKIIYVVTGAFGHLGNVIVRYLLLLKQKVRCFVLPNDKSTILKDFPEAEVFRGDITKKETLDLVLTHKDDEDIYLIHSAGIVSIYQKCSKLMYDVNVIGTKNLIEKAIQFHVKKFLYISSVHAIPTYKQSLIKEISYFDPNTVKGGYAKTKAMATQLVLDNKDQLDVVIVHPSGIIGPYDPGNNHTTTLIKKVIEGTMPMGVKGGYDFVDVRDVAKGCYMAMQYGNSGDCYILSNKKYMISDLYSLTSKYANTKRIKVFLPIWFVKLIAPLCEWYYKSKKQNPLVTRYSLYTLNEKIIFNHDKATSNLGFEPRSMDETIKDTIKWLKFNK